MDICTDSLIPGPQPITSYNCVNGSCILISGSSGQYDTQAECELNCTLPVPADTIWTTFDII